MAVELKGPLKGDIVADIREEGDFLYGEYADFAINVKYYDPRPLVSSTIEKGNAPIIVHLAAIPTVPMTSLPRIQRVSVREVGTNVLTGGVRYFKPTLYSWDDFGYLQVNLKRIEKEADVPDRIIANLTMRIDYESDVLPGLVGGTTRKKLKKIGDEVEEWEKTEEKDRYNLIRGADYEIFRGKGYVVAEEIEEKSAKFIVYNSAGRPYRVSVEKGKESGPILLVAGSRNPDDYVRVRVDEIKDGEVSITLLGGVKRDVSEVGFKLNIPVDKRPFDLTTTELKNHMEWTNKTIIQLDNYINDLEKFVEDFYSLCLITTGLMIAARFFGIGKVGVEKTKEEIAKAGATRVDVGEAIEATADKPEVVPPAAERGAPAPAVPIVESGLPVDVENLPEGYEILYGRGPGGSDVLMKGNKEIAYLNRDTNIPGYIFPNSEISSSVIGIDYITGRATEAPKLEKELASTTEEKSTDKEMSNIYVDNFKGENVITVPIKDLDKLPLKENERKSIETWLEENGKKDVYALYSDKTGVSFFARIGDVDGGNIKLDDKGERDIQLTQVYDKDTNEYKSFSGVMRNVRNAQLRGEKKVENVFGSDVLKIGAKTMIREAGLDCIDYMSVWQCNLIFNACDPVICPTSRCNFGGRTRLEQSVQQSGLVASIGACIHNAGFPPDGVIVPVCLTGILASLKNIRSYVQAYQKCLDIRIKEGRSVGFCDRTRSVFICEILWRHVFDPMGKWIGAKMSRASKNLGGAEVLEDPKSKLGRSKRAMDYFTEDYYKEIIGAYEGRLSKEIGEEICGSAISGKFPSFKGIFEEVLAGGNPVQYTAQFEEHSYSAAAGASRYYGYYHIYAGSSEKGVDFVINLRNCGNKPYIPIDRGNVKPEDFADKSFEVIGEKGCKEICVIINGEEKCAFGKVVSTSEFIENKVENYVANQVAKKITKTKNCVPSYDSYIGASVNKQCAAIDLSKIDEKWKEVGYCDDEEIRCWVYVDINDKNMEKEIREIADRELCEGEICNRNRKCEGGVEVEIEGSYDVCCEGGKCESKDFVNKGENNLNKVIYPRIFSEELEWGRYTGLGYGDKSILDKWYESKLKYTGDVDDKSLTSPKETRILKELVINKADAVYFYIGIKFLYDADYENAEKIIFLIEKDPPFSKGDDFISYAWKQVGKEEFEKFEERAKKKYGKVDREFAPAEQEQAPPPAPPVPVPPPAAAKSATDALDSKLRKERVEKGLSDIPSEPVSEAACAEFGVEWLHRLFTLRDYKQCITEAERLITCKGRGEFLRYDQGRHAYYLGKCYYYNEMYKHAENIFIDLNVRELIGNFYDQTLLKIWLTHILCEYDYISDKEECVRESLRRDGITYEEYTKEI